ncbi:GlxA family transcriptional regulator [Tabrizicola sp.]|jgi:transcriptional regulator GlxA family with amidase domain|uniref:GlxA family transcriptional regulator n=1 Tax=Tabrizicola sp. TaxID=2005166 RepID=UPI001A5D3188|nr:GlxA family transcriptional regulator [Tabrizicola sp.]MBL9063119.1 GlxA family transcriptional regulator [Tabrizicola sp.]
MSIHAKGNRFDPATPVIPRGVAFLRLPGAVTTRHFAFLALPRFTLLAFSSAIEPLRIANQLTQQPLYSWSLLSADGAPVESSAGIRVEVDRGLAPLGRDATVVVCSGTDASQAADLGVLSWLRSHQRIGGRIGAICTGAYTLARAGLLGGHSPAVHWENQPAFRELFDVEPLQQIYSIGPKHFSCAGGEAGVDMMLALIAKDYGDRLADAVAEMCLHFRRREASVTQKAIYPTAMGVRHPGIAKVISVMKANIATPLDQGELADIFGRTTRHLERTFKSIMQETPKSYYLGLRLEEARNLLSETQLSILEVAVATGFNSRSSFSKAYKARYGKSPSNIS